MARAFSLRIFRIRLQEILTKHQVVSKQPKTSLGSFFTNILNLPINQSGNPSNGLPSEVQEVKSDGSEVDQEKYSHTLPVLRHLRCLTTYVLFPASPNLHR